MHPGFFFQGILMGFLVAVPVGPVGLLCINRALTQGPRLGLVSGLGVAAADALAASIALLGLTLISNPLVTQQVWLRSAGGLFLCYLGVRTFLAKPPARVESSKESGIFSAAASTFFLTVTNPVTVSSFVAIFAAFAVGSSGETPLSAAMLIGGVFVGSALWWVLLSVGLRLLGARLSSGRLWWVSRISGVAITGFGFVVLFNVWQKGF